jgi:hypothetical protein
MSLMQDLINMEIEERGVIIESETPKSDAKRAEPEENICDICFDLNIRENGTVEQRLQLIEKTRGRVSGTFLSCRGLTCNQCHKVICLKCYHAIIRTNYKAGKIDFVNKKFLYHCPYCRCEYGG